MLKKSQVVMLPTNQKVNNKYPINQLFLMGTRLKLGTGSPLDILGGYFKPQHLYFLDDEIKEGEWCINFSKPVPTVEIYTKAHFMCDCKKIIATTNPELNTDNRKYIYAQSERIHLPQPSQSFLEKYIAAYNAEKPIVKVMVEYDKSFNGYFEEDGEDWRLSLRVARDNTITIRPVKDSWSRDEVILLIRKAFEAARLKDKAVDKVGYSGITGQKRKYTFTADKWIEENL